MIQVLNRALHIISVSKEAAHQHMDFLYLARPLDEDQELILAEEEGHEIRWFTREEIEKLDEKMEIFSNVKRYILSMLQ